MSSPERIAHIQTMDGRHTLANNCCSVNQGHSFPKAGPLESKPRASPVRRTKSAARTKYLHLSGTTHLFITRSRCRRPHPARIHGERVQFSVSRFRFPHRLFSTLSNIAPSVHEEDTKRHACFRRACGEWNGRIERVRISEPKVSGEGRPGGSPR